MFEPKQTVKNDPEKRWYQSDRVFFGFGACHILAGVFLEDPPLEGFYGEWIVPAKGYSGTHIYATNGVLAFDFHGYSYRENLLAKYWRGQQKRCPDWAATIIEIDFHLLDTAELSKRKHLGADQYFNDPRPRAKQFISAIKPPTFSRGRNAAGGHACQTSPK
ncbi:hypothetical protein ROLI_039930 [Roseobacter fucihabitans]|uniref:Uncharacterized protein n=2 Tax=Roseobacter fucihabitans TaxID=1537242 RepID=A0ABZ2BYR2_9RHOB|nr:hypothetical protein [Roseobacter litoralis]